MKIYNTIPRSLEEWYVRVILECLGYSEKLDNMIIDDAMAMQSVIVWG